MLPRAGEDVASGRSRRCGRRPPIDEQVAICLSRRQASRRRPHRGTPISAERSRFPQRSESTPVIRACGFPCSQRFSEATILYQVAASPSTALPELSSPTSPPLLAGERLVSHRCISPPHCIRTSAPQCGGYPHDIAAHGPPFPASGGEGIMSSESDV